MAFRTVVPRDPGEEHRAATPLEAFTDLCFVVAIAQASAVVHHHWAEGHVVMTLGAFAAAFFGIWWAWLNFAWFCSAYDNDDAGHRILSLVQIFGSLIFAAGVTRMFEGDFGIAVTGYVVMRLALVAQWLRAAAGDRARRATALRYALGISLVQIGWVAFLLLPEPAVWPAFALLAGGELYVPRWAERAGRTPWHPHHIAERYNLFYMIVLGESVLSATVAIQKAIDADHLRVDVAVVVIGGVLTVFSLWWLYFSHDAGDALEDRGEAFGWGFGHYFVFAAVALIGAGLAVRVDYRIGDRQLGGYESAALVTIPVAVLLTSMWLVSIRLYDGSIRTCCRSWSPSAPVWPPPSGPRRSL